MPSTASPLRPLLLEAREQFAAPQARISRLEVELARLAPRSPACRRLRTLPGVGLLTATAMVAVTSAEVTHFKDARHFASRFGLTPMESSSGMTRRLGRISKCGDRYLRMRLTHGARGVLRAATVADPQGRPVDPLRCWALGIQERAHHNRATCALANKGREARKSNGRSRERDRVIPRRSRWRRSSSRALSLNFDRMATRRSEIRMPQRSG